MKRIRTIFVIAGCLLFVSLGSSYAQILAKTEAGGKYDAFSKEICPLMDNLIIEKTKNKTDSAKPIGATLKPSNDGFGFSATAGQDGMHFGIDLISGGMNLGVGLLHDLKERGLRIIFSKGSLKCGEKTFVFDEGAYIVARDSKIYGWNIKVQKGK